MNKIIFVSSCRDCPLFECDLWVNMPTKDKAILLISDGMPEEFILKDCPLENQPLRQIGVDYE